MRFTSKIIFLADETVKEKVNNITDNLVCISEDSIISSNEDKKNLERDEHKEMTIESTNLSMENFEALEAKLAQVMSKVHCLMWLNNVSIITEQPQIKK